MRSQGGITPMNCLTRPGSTGTTMPNASMSSKTVTKTKRTAARRGSAEFRVKL